MKCAPYSQHEPTSPAPRRLRRDLHYRPSSSHCGRIPLDINVSSTRRSESDRTSLPLRGKLLGYLPMINVITGLVGGGRADLPLQRGGGGTDAWGIQRCDRPLDLIHDQLRADSVACGSILRPWDLEAETNGIRQGRFDEQRARGPPR